MAVLDAESEAPILVPPSQQIDLFVESSSRRSVAR